MSRRQDHRGTPWPPLSPEAPRWPPAAVLALGAAGWLAVLLGIHALALVLQ